MSQNRRLDYIRDNSRMTQEDAPAHHRVQGKRWSVGARTVERQIGSTLADPEPGPPNFVEPLTDAS